METKIKPFFFGALALAAIMVGGAALQYVSVFSRSIQPSSFRSFSVSADGRFVAVPDVAEFTFSVLNQGGKDLAALHTDNTKKTEKVIAFLKNSGIDAKDIKTESYNVTPRYQSYDCPVGVMSVSGSAVESAMVRPCPPADIVGYEVNQTVRVKVRDFSKIGDVVSGVVTNGANTVSQLAFTMDDPALAQAKARENAITKAKEKARSIAGATGFRLGRLLEIQEGGGYPSPYYRNTLTSYAADGVGGAFPEMKAAPIEAGSQDVTVTITLRYEID
ncbi:MAG: hypothetical protein RIQ54_217 [Candidatus Parcubacteria bacterium]